MAVWLHDDTVITKNLQLQTSYLLLPPAALPLPSTILTFFNWLTRPSCETIEMRLIFCLEAWERSSYNAWSGGALWLSITRSCIGAACSWESFLYWSEDWLTRPSCETIEMRLIFCLEAWERSSYNAWSCGALWLSITRSCTGAACSCESSLYCSGVWLTRTTDTLLSCCRLPVLLSIGKKK